MIPNSALLPSPLLTPLSALTSTQQKILKKHSTHLNMQKYKKGKTLYLAYIQAKSNPKSQRYIQFIQQFTDKNYVNKMLLISSMKYYRDIKQILIGGPADAGIQADKRFKYIQIDLVLKQLDAYAKFDEQTEQLMNNTEKAQKELAVSIQLRKQQEMAKQARQGKGKDKVYANTNTNTNANAQQKFSRSNHNNTQNSRNRNNIQTNQNNITNTQYHLNHIKPIRQIAKTLTYDSQVQQITPITYNAVPNNSPCAYQYSKSQNQEELLKSQKSSSSNNKLQYIKLIQVKMQNNKNNNKNNMSLSTKSDRIYTNYSNISNKGSPTQRSTSQQNQLLNSLRKNNLYQKRITSLSVKNNKNSNKNQIIKNNQTKPINFNKYHKNTNKKTPIGSGICNKLLQCLRYIGILPRNNNGYVNEQNKQISMIKIKQSCNEEKKPLIISKVSTKTQITNTSKKYNTK